MDNSEFKRVLYDRLAQLDVFYTHGPEEVSVRCPFCGDSRRNYRSAHFYIKISSDDKVPILYNCFRSECGESGVLNSSILRELDIRDLEVFSGLTRYNKRATKVANAIMGVKDNNFNLRIPSPDESNPNNIAKRDYINSRLGLNLTFEDLVQKKVIFSLVDLLKYNEIQNLTVNRKRGIALQQHYIGFMSMRNEFITFRNLTNEGDRYYIYSVYKNIDNSRKMYAIPSQVDLLSNETITINIAEGVIDILGIYYHVFDQDETNNLFVAVNGAAFKSAIRYFIQLGIVGNVIINIFADQGESESNYSRIVKDIGPWVQEINLYYNTKAKDYGVPKNMIKLQKRKIPKFEEYKKKYSKR